MRLNAWPGARLSLLLVVLLGPTPRARAQLPTSEERIKILTDPESVKKKVEKDRIRPPIELPLTQVAPFDVLPFVKANHWISMNLEMISNYEDIDGTIETTGVMLAGQPQEVVYGRDLRLQKTQLSRLGFQLLFPEIPGTISLSLTRADATRPLESWQASLRTLEPHQMLVVFLTKEPSDIYASWNRYQSMFPLSADRGDQLALEKQRYYRTIMPLKPERPPLSPHPLTWTTISHIVWDGMPPDNLNPSQQQALLDWLHWGGQLIIVGGPGPGFSLLKDSFIAPYLPAEATGENALLNKDDLVPLSREYRPPALSSLRSSEDEVAVGAANPVQWLGRRYLAPVPIEPRPNRPVFLAGLQPKPGALAIPLGESSPRILGVEQRVGRGRILMLGMSLNDPTIAAWSGVDTLIRRLILRRPEEAKASRVQWDGMTYRPPRYAPLSGTDLSWFRLISRDLGGPGPRPQPVTEDTRVTRAIGRPLRPNGVADDPSAELKVPEVSVADWNDGSTLPRTCRTALEVASGIKVPTSGFVLKLILAYILALVPLNWLICRYVFNRREMAWVVIPVLSLIFAIGVERAAAYDLGYDSACDEIDVMEVFADYPRAHVSRFASIYSTGRTRYNVSFPNDPTALVLPLDNGRSLRGEDISSAAFRSFPIPTLRDYLVQPRSLAFYRSEQMTTLDGSVSLVTEGESRRVVNGMGVTLRDAVLIDFAGAREEDRRTTYLGDLAPGAGVDARSDRGRPTGTPRSSALDRSRVVELLETSFEDRPENVGELRLVAWIDAPVAGTTVEPTVDRHRGLTVVVAHLRHGQPPAPDGPRYYDRSSDQEVVVIPARPGTMRTPPNGPRGRLSIPPPNRGTVTQPQPQPRRAVPSSAPPPIPMPDPSGVENPPR